MIFNPDCSLIKAWDDVTVLPLAAPFVSAFNRAGKSLHYIAARHEGGLQSPTLRTVNAEFEKFRPHVVILEGMPNTGEVSPSWYLEHCRAQAREDFAAGGEASYAAVLAGERGIDFVSGEPSDRNLYEGLAAQGFTRADFLGWHITVVMRHHIEGGVLEAAAVGTLVERQAQNILYGIGVEGESFSSADFRAWYRDRMGCDFTLGGLAAIDGSPSRARDANALQAIMSAADNVREPHIVKTIAQQLEAHDRVLVVYGSAHLGKQEAVLRKMMGSVRHFKPFS